MAVDHYENFPVASILLPAHLREPVGNIYRFARSADDIADEGSATNRERLSALAGYREALQQIRERRPHLSEHDPRFSVFSPLADTIVRFSLPFEPFFDLLSAFEQDVAIHRYPDRAALLDYCRRSANPVGRLMLHLYGRTSLENDAWSDAICTGLQLVNFWQDVAVDWRKSRVYLPQDQLDHYGVKEQFIGIHAQHSPPGKPARRATRDWGGGDAQAWRALMRAQCAHAGALLAFGLPLVRQLPVRAGLELKLVILGGLRILERLDKLHYDMFECRPTLGKRDWALLLWRAAMRQRRSGIGPVPGKS